MGRELSRVTLLLRCRSPPVQLPLFIPVHSPCPRLPPLTTALVSQATHFVDLCRYLCGDADDATLSALTLTRPERAGSLSKLVTQDAIPDEFAVPRVTDAMWKTTSGGICTLVHAVALHDGGYDAELTLITDGWKLRLIDPYGVPKLVVRAPGKVEEEVKEYGADDPFYTEISVMVDVVEGTLGEEEVLSTFGDALKTYELVSARSSR